MYQRYKWLLLAPLFSSSALAGGLALYETSPSNGALANAGAAARAQDPSTLATNPAGMTRLKGTQLQVNAGLVGGDMDIALDNGGDGGGNPVQTAPLGSLYVTHAVNDRWSVGIGMFGSHGLGLDYDPNWDGRRRIQHSELTAIAVAPSLAYRLDDHWSVGASLLALQGRVEVKSSPLPNVAPAVGLNFSGSDWAYGASLGVLYEKDADTRLGLSYVSELKWELEGNLLPSTDQSLQSTIGMAIPQNLTLSGYHRLDARWALLASANWQQWSRFGEVEIAHPRFSASSDLGYRDTWHLSAGAQFAATERLRLSGGVGYDSSPVDDAHRTVSIPMGSGWRFGLGGLYQLTPATGLEFGYTLAWLGDMPFSQAGLSGSYDNSRLHFFTLGLQHSF